MAETKVVISLEYSTNSNTALVIIVLLEMDIEDMYDFIVSSMALAAILATLSSLLAIVTLILYNKMQREGVSSSKSCRIDYRNCLQHDTNIWQYLRTKYRSIYMITSAMISLWHRIMDRGIE